MSKEIYISSTPHETRLAIVEKDELTEIYYERENEYTLAGSIYNGRVTRVLPGMQSSFVDVGLERDAFLYITDFMEEAGDAADFEGAATSGEPRAPRAESQPRPESGRSEGDRNGGGRREGRGRGRGRDGHNREGRPEAASPEAATDQFSNTSTADDEGFYSTPETVPGATDTEEIGEGAPGADGSRRWRGRRGRRRGRTGNGEAGTEAQQTPEPVEATAVEAVPQQQDRTPREGRRERGGRDRNNDHGDRSSRDNSRQDAIRERFAPRGARPSAPEEETIDLSAQAEPFILPGESLSKYRRNADGTPEAAPKPAFGTLVAARPSSEVAPLTGWDGGSVLPGETLSRRSSPRFDNPGEHRPEGRREANDRSDGGRNRRRDRDQQRGRGGRDERTSAPREQTTETSFRAAPQGLSPAERVQPGVTSQHDTGESLYEPAHAEPTHSEPGYLEPAYETQTDAIEVDAEIHAETLAAVEELHEAVAEFHETTTEYEPGDDASASFRVDPVSPREFRQATPPEEIEVEEIEEVAEPVTAQHEFTSLQPGGEMVSEDHEHDASIHEASIHAAPIEHETAVQPEPLDHAVTVPFEVTGAFAPGEGELEEELLDEEDAEPLAVQASAFDDDTEEVEAVEHAAELGRMIRDMSIDAITRPEPIEHDDDEEEDHDFDEEDEDFEEDELESNSDELEDDEVSSGEVSEAEEEEFAEATIYDEEGNPIAAPAPAERAPREGNREGRGRGRRDGRRGGRDRNAISSDRPSTNGDRSEPSERTPDRGNPGSRRDGRGMAGSRHGGRSGGGGDRRHGSRSVQATNLPAISDLLKPGQEVLVQIAKEPIAKKGARITSHIALPGRFLVFMPTVSHTGVSRKIESDSERRRLKEILLSERGDATGGFIVRTAAAGATEEELRSDLRFLLNLWADIKTRSESSKSPALIYHDLNLIERILRDQVTDNFSAIWVDTEAEYERVLRFLQRFQPALMRRVKLYVKDTPLFEQFGINTQIDNALRAKVWLKSGGSIVINQTEALVAIDINTGKFVGKTTKLEDTILKTNLDAIPEIVRQMRLRDLGGIIIIDFIDMDERKNRNKVMAALEEELKKDRAPSKMLSFNDFGLIAITRKRVKQTLERTLSTTCGICQGTGMVKSPVTVCNDIYIEMRKMQRVIEKGDIMLRVNPEVVKQLKSGGGKWLQEMEEMSGKTILVKSDPSLHPEQFDIH